MATPFERIPQVPEAEEVVDSSLAKASRVAETRSGVESQQGMTSKAAERITSRLRHVVDGFPSFDRLDGVYRELAEVLVDVDDVRRALGRVDGAADQIDEIARQTQQEIADVEETQEAVDARRRAFARMDSVVRQLDGDLGMLAEAREKLTDVPEIGDEPAVVLAGTPNAGKSTLLREMTSAKPDVDDYAFTTQSLEVGHLDVGTPGERVQVVETPGLLDRDADDRNEMERQAEVVLERVADLVVWLYDPSETCGYPMETQERLRGDVVPEGLPVLEVANKVDLESPEVDVDVEVSAVEGEGVDVLMELVEERLPGGRRVRPGEDSR